MSSRTQRVISLLSEKIVSFALSMRMTLSQISLTRAKRENDAKRAFTDKKPFLSLNCREREAGLNRLREPSVEQRTEEKLSKEEKGFNF